MKADGKIEFKGEHNHKCHVCEKVWGPCYHKECFLGYDEYPCSTKCLIKGGHLLFLGTTPEAAKEASELEEKLRNEGE